MDIRKKLLFTILFVGLSLYVESITSSSTTAAATTEPTSSPSTVTTVTTVTAAPTTPSTLTPSPTTNGSSTQESSSEAPTTPQHTTQTPLPSLDGYQYLFQLQQNETEISFESAQNNCVLWGGNLVSILDKEENDFIVQNVIVNYNGSAWIGLQQTEDTYRWSDNSTFNFTNGLSEAPDSNDTQCFVIQDDGNWLNVSCESTQLAYICKQIVSTPAPTVNGTTQGTGDDGGSGGLSDTAVIAVSVAMVLLVVALALGAVLLFIKKKRRPKMDAFTLLDNDQCDFVNNTNTVTLGDSY